MATSDKRKKAKIDYSSKAKSRIPGDDGSESSSQDASDDDDIFSMEASE